MEKKQNNSDKILFIAKNENLSIRSLEEMIGTSQGVLNKIVKNNGEIKSSILEKILELFPHYESYWLITGKGNILKSEIKTVLVEPNNQTIMLLLERIEKLSSENALLKAEIEQIKQQKKYRDLTKPDIAAEPELKCKNSDKNK